MIINHNNKYIFLCVPKTGSKSISAYLGQPKHPEPDQYHMGIRRVLAENQETSGYFKFAFVRNPWSRLVSLYNDFTLNRKNQYSQLVTMPRPLLSEFENFKKLCICLKDSHWSRNLFFVPQVKLVTLEDGSLIDYVGRFENLSADLDKVVDRLDLPRDVNGFQHLNKGVYDKSYRDYYDAESREAIARFYADDISLFDYRF